MTLELCEPQLNAILGAPHCWQSSSNWWIFQPCDYESVIQQWDPIRRPPSTHRLAVSSKCLAPPCIVFHMTDGFPMSRNPPLKMALLNLTLVSMQSHVGSRNAILSSVPCFPLSKRRGTTTTTTTTHAPTMHQPCTFAVSPGHASWDGFSHMVHPVLVVLPTPGEHWTTAVSDGLRSLKGIGKSSIYRWNCPL